MAYFIPYILILLIMPMPPAIREESAKQLGEFLYKWVNHLISLLQSLIKSNFVIQKIQYMR